MIRIAVAGPDGAGKSTVCFSLLQRMDNAKLQYAGKNRGHLLQTTGFGLRLWNALKKHGIVFSYIGQYLIFYPFEYFENLFRFRMTPSIQTQCMIYDRHPIDRMVLKHDILLKYQQEKINGIQFIAEYPFRWLWGYIYQNMFPRIEKVYVLLPDPLLCFKRSKGQYKSFDEAIRRVDAYRRTVLENKNNKEFIPIVIHHELTVEKISQTIFDDIIIHKR